jgi:hypothetical protein
MTDSFGDDVADKATTAAVGAADTHIEQLAAAAGKPADALMKLPTPATLIAQQIAEVQADSHSARELAERVAPPTLL